MKITKIVKSAFLILVIVIPGTMPIPFFGDEWARDFPPGTRFPDISAIDQWGNHQSIKALIGNKGLAIFFNRSTVW